VSYSDNLFNLSGLERFVRVLAVAIGVPALPMIFFLSIMATDSGTPKAMLEGKILFFAGLGIDILGIACAFVPEPDPLPEGRRLIGYVLLRLPTYLVAVGGVWAFIMMLLH
jgi:hypothetical protein